MKIDDFRAFARLFKKAIEAVMPDLRKALAPVRRGRVTAVKPAGGTYVCEVQAVLNDGRPDPDAPVIPDVEIPSVWAGRDRGLVCPPTVGEYCDIGFYDGDLNYPFILNFRPSQAPDVELDSLMIQHSPGIRLGFKPDGTVIIEAPKIEATATEHITAKAKTIEATAETHIKAESPLVEVTAENKVSIVSPLVEIDGHLTVSNGISAKRGRKSNAIEIDGHVKIINGGLDAQNSVTAGQNMSAGNNIEAGRDIKAGGKVTDTGGNTNHHTHT